MLRDQERSISHLSSKQRDKEMVRQRESGREDYTDSMGGGGKEEIKLHLYRCLILIAPLSENRMQIVSNGLKQICVASTHGMF